MSEQRKVLRFQGESSVPGTTFNIALQAVPPHCVLLRMEEEDGFRSHMHLDPEHVRMLVKFLQDNFLSQVQ